VACLKAISAQALSRLGRAPDALATAQAALDLARSIRSKLWEVEALRALAEVHATHAGKVTGGDPRLALDYLLKALAVVDEIGGHHEKSEIYTELAQAHEAAGDPANALVSERAARAEDLREQNRRARTGCSSPANATRPSASGRGRAAALACAAQAGPRRCREESLHTLDELRRVGQDITAELDPGAMLAVLERHLARLADVALAAIFVFDARGGMLTRHAIERERALPVKSIPLENLESYAARAARTRTELYIEAEEGTRASTRIAGTEVTRSIWFGPMLRGEDLHGVLSVQSTKLGAYGEREKLVFRTVAGYAAVALANARIHGELERNTGASSKRKPKCASSRRPIRSRGSPTGGTSSPPRRPKSRGPPVMVGAWAS
jgi:tetratricopeptide (TPR) repeat protein